jgi:hypothetical protein
MYVAKLDVKVVKGADGRPHLCQVLPYIPPADDEHTFPYQFGDRPDHRDSISLAEDMDS